MKQRPVIKNAKGEPILLNHQEQALANHLQRQFDEKYRNALGYEIDITTLTTIMKKVTDQKFFQIAPADYLPVRVGEGAWSAQLLTYRSFLLGDQFEKGVVNTGANNDRLAQADAGVDSLSIKVYNWAKSIGWSIMDLNQAAKAGNWDLVTAKEKARKMNWDLGIQRVAFLGGKGLGSECLGLLTQSGITTNTTLITTPIKSMSPAQLKTFLAGLVAAYRFNNNYTAWPTHFGIPESDYLGLASQASADFPVKSVLELITEALRTICRNPNFQVLPLAYAQATLSEGVLSTDRYFLLNYDEESIRMDIPVDYTNTLANSLDNFMFQNVGYGQFTGVLAYRPLELMYFDLTP